MLTLATVFAHLTLHLVSDVVLLEKALHRLEALHFGFGLELGLAHLWHAVDFKELRPLLHLAVLLVTYAKIIVLVSQLDLDLLTSLPEVLVGHDVELSAEELGAPL